MTCSPHTNPPPLALALQAQLAMLLDMAGSAIDAIRDRHCTEPHVTLARKVPARVSGPQFNLTLTAANCSLSVDLLAGQKGVECYGPGIAYSKVRGGEAQQHE